MLKKTQQPKTKASFLSYNIISIRIFLQLLPDPPPHIFLWLFFHVGKGVFLFLLSLFGERLNSVY